MTDYHARERERRKIIRARERRHTITAGIRTTIFIAIIIVAIMALGHLKIESRRSHRPPPINAAAQDISQP